jgi:hypothetical protein
VAAPRSPITLKGPPRCCDRSSASLASAWASMRRMASERIGRGSGCAAIQASTFTLTSSRRHA